MKSNKLKVIHPKFPVFGLLSLLFFASSFSQTSNQEFYTNLLKQTPKAWQVDSLKIGDALVQYHRLSKDLFERKMQIPLQLGKARQTLTQTDSLNRKSLKLIRSQSPPQLKGESPTLAAKIWRPFTLVMGSVGLVAALFYVRSR